MMTHEHTAHENAHDPEQLERNKEVVQRLFEVIYGDGTNIDIVDEVLAEDYLQHNEMVGMGREGFKQFFAAVLPFPYRNDPRTVTLVAERDIVVRYEERENGLLIDIFRVGGGRLLEHWDAYRANPGTTPPAGF